MYSQDDSDYPAAYDDGSFVYDPVDTIWSLMFSGLWQIAQLVHFVFVIWMAVECLRKEPHRFLWIWLILVVQPIGPYIYFFARWLQGNDVRTPRALKSLTRGNEIQRLSIAAQQIGNAHQFVQLGDAQRETGKLEPACDSYAHALEKDDSNIQALWGAGLTDFGLRNFDSAHEHLVKLLDIDPQYKFGDVSLLFGKTLCAQGDVDKAQSHLESHIKRWRHPEALYALATLEADRGNDVVARSHLQAMLMDINGSPTAIARKHMAWKGKAQKMLRQLPQS